jgi:hypothetical protein
MSRGVCGYLVSSIVLLVVLAGCGGFHMFAEREPWRHDAEVRCLSSGAVREGPGKVRIDAIRGPGVCGADFPLKVSMLGESRVLGYGDELRPPGTIPNGFPPPQPRWPVSTRAVPARELPPLGTAPDLPQSVYEPAPLRADRPLSLEPPGIAAPLAPLPAAPAPQMQIAPLGPARAPQVTGAIAPVSVNPPATLACPLVSVLDQWIAEAVQPAAMRWFGQPVVEIKQISAYSCRGMNGDPNAHISEHAFGNALDVAAFTLADGRKITVQNGWHGLPEEQGFLHDVQAAACDDFTTVLAPGSNAYHYNHIHVDLMRRASGRRACNPHALSGEEVAARARGSFAGRQGSGAVTGSIAPHRLPAPAARLSYGADRGERFERALPDAVAGEDGED